MVWCFSKTGYDFRLSDLPYKVKGSRQYFSSEGGVFSFDYKQFDYAKREYYESPGEHIQFENEKIQARILSSHNIEIYDGPKDAKDNDRSEYDFDNQIVASIAEAVRMNVSLPDDESDFELLFVEIDAKSVSRMPVLLTSVKLIDENQQSLAARFVGVHVSRRISGAVCLFLLESEQSRIVTFMNEEE